MTHKWRVAIVDDEPMARLGLRRMVAALPDAIQVGEAESERDAVALLRETAPDIVFLDVNLPGGDAFDVLARSAATVTPTVVLVTAFEDHAVRAFDFGVVDYLLKPFDERRFRRAWERATAARRVTGEDASVPVVQQRRLLLRRTGRVHAVPLAEVHWIEAADNYVRVHADAGRFMWRAPLRAVAERLTCVGFVQTSRSALVNTRHVTSFVPSASGDARVKLRNGMEVQVSRRYRAAFEALMRGSAAAPAITIMERESCD